MDADRRRLVQVTLAATLWPAIARGATRPADPLDRAHLEAVRSGEPLLVLLAPADDEAAELRGQLFGAVLNHGSDVTLAALGTCRVVCAGAEEVLRALPQVGALPPEAWFVVICGPEVRVGGIVVEPGPRVEDERTHRDMAQLEAALVGAIGEPPAEAVPALAGRARERWVEGGAVPGSRWLSYSGGCVGEFRPERPGLLRRIGYVAEDVAHFPVMCGRAHVSALAARMIAFY